MKGAKEYIQTTRVYSVEEKHDRRVRVRRKLDVLVKIISWFSTDSHHSG